MTGPENFFEKEGRIRPEETEPLDLDKEQSHREAIKKLLEARSVVDESISNTDYITIRRNQLGLDIARNDFEISTTKDNRRGRRKKERYHRKNQKLQDEITALDELEAHERSSTTAEPETSPDILTDTEDGEGNSCVSWGDIWGKTLDNALENQDRSLAATEDGKTLDKESEQDKLKKEEINKPHKLGENTESQIAKERSEERKAATEPKNRMDKGTDPENIFEKQYQKKFNKIEQAKRQIEAKEQRKVNAIIEAQRALAKKEERKAATEHRIRLAKGTDPEKVLSETDTKLVLDFIKFMNVNETNDMYTWHQMVQIGYRYRKGHFRNEKRDPKIAFGYYLGNYSKTNPAKEIKGEPGNRYKSWNFADQTPADEEQFGQLPGNPVLICNDAKLRVYNPDWEFYTEFLEEDPKKDGFFYTIESYILESKSIGDDYSYVMKSEGEAGWDGGGPRTAFREVPLEQHLIAIVDTLPPWSDDFRRS